VADEFAVVDPDDVPVERVQTRETRVRKLTERLGCTDLRVNQVLVDPGEVTTPHTHDEDGREREEVFVAVTAGQTGSTARSTACRRAGRTGRVPEPAEPDHVWLAFGAPAVGSVAGFGAYVVEE
jgi:hypothetical protein